MGTVAEGGTRAWKISKKKKKVNDKLFIQL